MKPAAEAAEGALRAFRFAARGAACTLALALAPCAGVAAQAPGNAAAASASVRENAARHHGDLRIAVFNIRVLSTAKITDVDSMGHGRDPQLRAAAAVIRSVRPDVLILNELWHDVAAHEAHGAPLDLNARRFARAYLEDGDDGVAYPYAFAAPCNTGRASGFDLDGDGEVAAASDLGTPRWAGDAWGWGREPGEFSMGMLSRFPVDTAGARTFARFHWADLPGHHMPAGFYPAAAVRRMPLSSKAHWDVPIVAAGDTVHVFMCVPTPGIFDGPEDRNGLRNFDEVGFWVHYLDDDGALVDDRGVRGGYRAGASFVIAGDLNAFEEQDTRVDGRVAIRQLKEDPRIRDTGPWLASPGAAHGVATGPPAWRERDTVIDGDFRARLDYILPSRDLEVKGGGVWWPDPVRDPEGRRLAEAASDHRLIWLDVALPSAPGKRGR